VVRAGELIAEGQKEHEIACPEDFGRGRSEKSQQLSLSEAQRGTYAQAFNGASSGEPSAHSHSPNDG